MGQIIGEMGIGEMGVGEMGVRQIDEQMLSRFQHFISTQYHLLLLADI